MTVINRWLEFLNQSGIRYSHSVHPPAETALATADAERVPPREFAKVVVYFCDTGYGMAVVAANQLVDLAEAGRLLGASFIRLATEAEMCELFPDCETGAVPAFGNVYRMPVLLDAGIGAREFIAFTLGTHRDVVRMSTEDYRKMVKPLEGEIAVRAHRSSSAATAMP